VPKNPLVAALQFLEAVAQTTHSWMIAELPALHHCDTRRIKDALGAKSALLQMCEHEARHIRGRGLQGARRVSFRRK